MPPVARPSAFLNNTPVVAIFIPAVDDWARRYRLETSRLMIPLSYASIAGGTRTLTGTSTTLVVDGLYAARTGAPWLTLFELAGVGVPLAATVLLCLLVAGHWILPRRPPTAESYQYVRRYTPDMLIPADSPLVGKSVEEAGLRQPPGLFLIEIDRGGKAETASAVQDS